MPLYMGDIADLYDWEDAHNDRKMSQRENLAEQRVGTQASFEQLLEHELAKEQAQGMGGSSARRCESVKGPIKQFLRKGARGWWMERPEAKRKMQRHVLESVEKEEGNQSTPESVSRGSLIARTKPPVSGRSTSRASSEDTNSPEPTKREEAGAPVEISPVRLSPSPRYEESLRRSLPMWATSKDARGVRTTNESVETLGMSAIREDFEARKEQEADELADFEALEQQLAAEKESYWREKQELHERESRDYDGDEASWLRDSDAASLRGESQYLHQATSRRSSYSNLDLGGDSAMVFEDTPVFRSPIPRTVTTTRSNSVSTKLIRHSFAPSDISAVSLNDSEPWGDANALNHFSNLSESPIAKRGDALAQLQGSDARSIASSRRESHWGGANGEYEDGGGLEDSFDHEDRGAVARSTSQRFVHPDAPISSLVQHVFGGVRQNDEDDQEQEHRLNVHDSRAQSRRTLPSHPPAQKRLPRSKKGIRDASSTNAKRREQKMREDGQSHPAPRQSAPGFNTSGMLPVSIEEKLAELEEEVRFYKSETLQLQRKKAQYDDDLQRIAREKENIVNFQEQQRQLIGQEWQRERQKMKQEERMFERQMKLKLSAAASSASRKDRAEIDALKAQIVALQLETKQSSLKMKSTNDVLRQRIAELEGQTREQSEEIKFLERDRLSQWQKYEDLLKELNSQKLNQDTQLNTVGDISRISKSAEEILSSFQTNTPNATQPSSKNVPQASTPMYGREDGYNPGRYREGETIGSSPRLPDQEPSRSVDNDADGSGVVNDDAITTTNSVCVNEVMHPGGKREITYRDGTKRIFFADGNEKEILPNGNVVIRFTNGDRKEYFPHTGVSVYHYHQAQTKLTTYPDKTKVYEFSNQQIEKTYPDGTTEIQFADGIKKTIHPNGDEFSRFPDGLTMLENKDGMREVTLLNGKRVRYYPDGSTFLVSTHGEESQVRSDEELRDLTENSR